MSTYVKTVSFKTLVVPDPNNDDPIVNSVIQRIHDAGGQVTSIDLSIGGGFSWVSTYVVTYDAPEPVEFEVPTSSNLGPYYWALVLLLGVTALGFAALLAMSAM